MSGAVNLPPDAVWTSLNQRIRLVRGSVVLCGFGLAPILLAYFQDLWARPQYQFFPLALAGAAALAWQRIADRRFFPPPRRQIWGFLWLLLSLAALALGIAFWLPLFGGLAFVCWLIGLALLLGGRAMLAAIAPSILMLLFLIPPLGLESEILRQLRHLAVLGSSSLLDYLRVLHAVEGNVIELPRKTLLVEEACSGINSVLLGMTFCIFYLSWQRRPVAWLIIALPVTFLFVMLGNVVRITLGAALQYFAGIDILSAKAHETAGLILVAVYLLLICSLDQLLVFLTYNSTAVEAPGQSPPPAPDSSAPFIKPAWLPAIGVAFALAGLTAVCQVIMNPQLMTSLGASHPKAIMGLKDNFNWPAQIGQWRRCDPQNSTNQMAQFSGVNSFSASYCLGNQKAVLAVDYPLRGYHDVKLCYSSEGWTVRDESITSADQSGAPSHFVEVNLRKNPLTFGFLCHAVIDARGHWLTPPKANPGAALVNRFRAMGRGFLTASTVRAQVLRAESRPLSDEERAEARELFLSACQLLGRQLSAK